MGRTPNAYYVCRACRARTDALTAGVCRSCSRPLSRLRRLFAWRRRR